MNAPLTEASYPALARAEWFAIVARGSIAFRFGPFTGPEIGEIMRRCTEEHVPLAITANCGTPFDWEVARDMRGDLSKLSWWRRLVMRFFDWRIRRVIARQKLAEEKEQAAS